MKPFWLAIQFLTRLPTPQFAHIDAKEMGRAIQFFPVVGLIIGAALVGVAQLHWWLPADMAAAFVLAFWAWITGGLHLDGLADTADGWLGGVGDKQRALEIMKDSRIGTGGGVALLLVLLLKWLALSYVIESQLWFVLALAPVLGRIASISLMPVTSYMSQQGIAEEMFTHLNKFWVLVWAVLALGMSLWLHPGLLVVLLLVWVWMRWIMVSITGGMTGDTAGAMTEVIETATLIAAIALFVV